MYNLQHRAPHKICAGSDLNLQFFSSPSIVYRRIRIQDPDPDLGSGSEIPEFHFEDPDPKFIISDSEHG